MKNLTLHLEESQYGKIIEDVCARDRQFFEQHPFAVTYWRDMVEHEFHPAFSGKPGEFKVCVTQVGLGARMRQPIQRKIAWHLEVLGYVTAFQPVGGLNYRDYLATEHWQIMRAHVLSRAKNRCELCYSPKQLNVHHKTYERLGAEDESDLIVLCRRCHAKFHYVLP